MHLIQNEQWNKDLDLIISHVPEVEYLDGKRILITGASGLIGSALVDVILRYNSKHGGSASVIVAGRSCEKMRQRFDPLHERHDIAFLEYDANNNNTLNLDVKPDYIIHGASNASPDKYMLEPVETMTSNFMGVFQLLQFARNNGCERVLFISSSEVYGMKDGVEPYQENQYGFIDLLQARSSYSVGKRATETLCVSFSSEYDVDTVIVRPGHIYGPTASVSDKRVSSQWSYDAAQGRDIVMKSDGKQIRSYCHCLDCASAILKVLFLGKCGSAYNISNPDSIISIREMADILSKSGHVELKEEYPQAAEEKSFNPMLVSALDSTSLEMLGWRGIIDAETGFKHTVQILKEILFY